MLDRYSANKLRQSACRDVGGPGPGCRICERFGGCVLPFQEDTAGQVKARVMRSHRILAAAHTWGVQPRPAYRPPMPAQLGQLRAQARKAKREGREVRP